MKQKVFLLLILVAIICLSIFAYIYYMYDRQIYMPYSEFEFSNIYYYKTDIKNKDRIKISNFKILYKDFDGHRVNINNNFYRNIDSVAISTKDKNITYLRLYDGDSNIYFVDKNSEVIKIFDKRRLFNPYKLFDPLNMYHKHIISPICEVEEKIQHKTINNKNVDYIKIDCSAIIKSVAYNTKLSEAKKEKVSWNYKLSQKYGLISYYLKDSNITINIELYNIKDR